MLDRDAPCSPPPRRWNGTAVPVPGARAHTATAAAPAEHLGLGDAVELGGGELRHVDGDEALREHAQAVHCGHRVLSPLRCRPVAALLAALVHVYVQPQAVAVGGFLGLGRVSGVVGWSSSGIRLLLNTWQYRRPSTPHE